MARQKQADTYTKYKEIRTDNAIINIFRPILSDDERERRYKEIARAAAELIIDTERGKRHEKETERGIFGGGLRVDINTSGIMCNG